MDFKNPFGLPDKITAIVKRGKSGKYLIDLPDLGTFTECERKEDVEDYVRDLLFCYYDVPKKVRSGIMFTRVTHSPLTDVTKADRFNYSLFLSSKIARQYLS